MRKEIMVKDIDCPNCAAKIERRIQKLEHVDAASLNFIGELLTIEAAEEHMKAVLDQAKEIIYDVEPDAVIEY